MGGPGSGAKKSKDLRHYKCHRCQGNPVFVGMRELLDHYKHAHEISPWSHQRKNAKKQSQPLQKTNGGEPLNIDALLSNTLAQMRAELAAVQQRIAATEKQLDDDMQRQSKLQTLIDKFSLSENSSEEDEILEQEEDMSPRAQSREIH